MSEIWLKEKLGNRLTGKGLNGGTVWVGCNRTDANYFLGIMIFGKIQTWHRVSQMGKN